jgi:hypothetical protein
MVLPDGKRADLYWEVSKELKNSKIEAKETSGIQRRGAKLRRRREEKTHLIRVMFLDSWVLGYSNTHLRS